VIPYHLIVFAGLHLLPKALYDGVPVPVLLFFMPTPAMGSVGNMLSGHLVIRPAVRSLSVRQHLFRVTRYLRTQWTDSDETRQKYSTRDWAFLQRFQRSEDKGQGHDQTIWRRHTFRRVKAHLLFLFLSNFDFDVMW